MSNPVISAGETWYIEGHTVQWLKDQHYDEPLKHSDLMIDGYASGVDDVMPEWLAKAIIERIEKWNSKHEPIPH